MLQALQDFTASLPAIWQWAAIFMAVAGNIVSMLIFVFTADKARLGVLKRRGGGQLKNGRKQQRFMKLFNKYGIPGVSLLGQALLPSQITSAMLVSVTGERNKVIGWQLLSILLWGTAFGLLATLGVVTVG